MKAAHIKIGARTLLVIGVFVLAVTAAALRGFEPGLTFATNGINLTVDSEASYNGAFYPSGTWSLKNLVPGVDKFFNFDDIKPGDQGENTISLHLDTPGWLCLNFTNLTQNENGINEPESHEDANGLSEGELAQGLEFFGWVDDGDNIFELGERPLFGTTTQSASVVLNDTTYAIADAANGSACLEDETCYFGVYWCAGNLTVDVDTATLTCDGTVLGNEAQTDMMSVDLSLTAYPANQYPGFICGEEPGETPTRTIGFWQTHTEFTSMVFNLPTMQKFVGVNAVPVAGSHKGTITNVESPGASQLFGAFYANIPKKTNNTNRSSVDKKRIQLLQQLMAAKLNCAAVACSAATLDLIADADLAYKNGTANITTLTGALDAYNNSGDDVPLPASLGSQGSATPDVSQSLADKVFWDLP